MEKSWISSPFVSHLIMDCCLQYTSSLWWSSFIRFLRVASSVWLFKFSQFPITCRSRSFAFFNSIWLLPNLWFLHRASLLRQLSNSTQMSTIVSLPSHTRLFQATFHWIETGVPFFALLVLSAWLMLSDLIQSQGHLYIGYQDID